MLQRRMKFYVTILVVACLGCAVVESTPDAEIQPDAAALRVQELIGEQALARLSPRHRSMLEQMLREPQYSQGVAACWSSIGSNPTTIAAFNAVIQGIGGDFQLNNRWNQTANGPTGSTGSPITLTYSFVPDGTQIPTAVGEPVGTSDLFAWMSNIYGGVTTWQNLFHQVFSNWGSSIGVTFVYEPNDDGASFSIAAQGVLGVRGDVRISAKTIDNSFGYLAYNHYPDYGDMVLDSADSLFDMTTNNSQLLRTVLAHEIGHGLGLEHVCPQYGTILMEPTIDVTLIGPDEPQHDDILGGQRNYGDPLEPSDSIVGATDLGSLPLATSTWTNLSIDDDSDTDYYRFTAPLNVQVDLTLTPLGSTYLQGPCNTASTPPFNSLTQQDLSLSLIDSGGIQIIGTAASQPAGVPEVLLDQPLTSGAGDYFIKIQGSGADSIQLYELMVKLESLLPPPVVSFTGTPTTGTVPLTVNFIDQSTGSPTSWTWDFGDGTTSTDQNPTHTYTTPGSYAVALTATNVSGSATLSTPNYITVDPSYQGSGADLQLEIGVNATPTPYPSVHPVSAGDVIHLLFWSPGGTYHLTPPLLAAQMFPTGSLPIGPLAFPEVHLSTASFAPYPAVVIYDGSFMGFTPGLPVTGFGLAGTVPAGMTPISIMLQGFCLAPNPNNPIFTATDAHEIRIQ